MELANAPYVHDPTSDRLWIVGKVKPGIDQAVVQHTFAQQAKFTVGKGQKLLAKAHVTLTPAGAGIQTMQEDYKDQLHLLMWIAGLVLLIACANIANLLLYAVWGERPR